MCQRASAQPPLTYSGSLSICLSAWSSTMCALLCFSLLVFEITGSVYLYCLQEVYICIALCLTIKGMDAMRQSPAGV